MGLDSNIYIKILCMGKYCWQKHNEAFIILNVILKTILRLGGGVAGGLKEKTM